MRTAWPLLATTLVATTALTCTLLRDLDDLPGDPTPSSTVTSVGSGGEGGGGDSGGGGQGANLGGSGGAGGSECPDFDAGGGGSASGGGSGGASGGGSGVSATGCSDGSRELFLDATTHPDIAGCSGGFSVPGVVTTASRNPQCGRRAGNDGAEPIGHGCTIEDLCAVGWHVCLDAAEVATRSGNGACASDASGFWATRQAQNNSGMCVLGTKDNLVGCGLDLGASPGASCDPLIVELSEVHCNESCSWICDGDGVGDEAEIVQKYGAEDGGVVCCRD